MTAPISRLRINGTFTTRAPMHVGSGQVTENPLLYNETNDDTCDVQAVVKDHRGLPCIPGTAVKGVLRAWAERFFSAHGAALDRIFGKRDAKAADAETGRAEFHTVVFHALGPHAYVDTVPYWNAKSATGIASSVSINRVTGAAERHKLFFHEFVPEDVTFDVEINAAGMKPEEIALLLAVLENGASHATHPYQFGANGADGWGRVVWKRASVKTWDGKTSGVGYACCTTPAVVPAHPTPAAAPAHVAFELALAFDGPFLVNDASRAHRDEDDELPNFVPLRRAAGGVWLPASSFRGVLRSRTEFLHRSKTQSDDITPVENIFGHTGKAARLTIAEFDEIRRCELRHQDFVAIDRFTGGAAEGAKFDAKYADRPTVKTKLVLDTDGLDANDLKLLAAALNDVRAGRLTFGFGGSKGYGEATGMLCDVGMTWLQAQLGNVATSSPLTTVAPALVQDALEVEANKNPNAHPNRYLRSTRSSGAKAPWAELSDDIRKDTAIGTFDVEYEMEGGQPVRIRYRGKDYVRPATSPKKTSPASTSTKQSSTHFAHPYYFLRLEDRTKFTGELQDAAPAGHDRLLPDRYSGALKVRLTTKTPMLICDPSTREHREGDHKDHFTYKVLKDVNDKPLLASSSVRGMFRAAYEAVTNSRFGVFPFKLHTDKTNAQGHARRLGFRLPVQSGAGVVPVRIVRGPQGALQAEQMNAAWIGMYSGHRPNNPSKLSLNHRDRVWAFVAKYHYHRVSSKNKGKVTSFDFWNVEEVAPDSPTKPTSTPTLKGCSTSYAKLLSPDDGHWEHGYVCVTRNNINNKHDERFFFSLTGYPMIDLKNSHCQQWNELVRDYHDQHEREIVRDGLTKPPIVKGRGKVFSRHITIRPRKLNIAEIKLDDGQLCYAKMAGASSIEALYPVMISRKLYDKSPRELLPDSLRPATSFNALSPADRVFGWVNQEQTPDGQEPAHRSHIRVGPVKCETDAGLAIETFNPPIPLAILGQPKPAQGRFYLGDKDGKAQSNGGTKEDRGYQGDVEKQTGNRIRGPKVYPHHRQGMNPDNYKAPAGAKQKSNQNRSITEWVKVDTTFTFNLHVQNLTEVELGALVWLLSLPEGQFLRLGLGKPLGFGSVRAEIVDSRVNTGAEWVKAMPSSEPAPIDLDSAREEFVAAINSVNPDLLKAFGIAAAGFADLPIHYPPSQPDRYRNDNQEDGGGKHYQWFGLNESSQRISLPDLPGKPGLPRTP